MENKQYNRRDFLSRSGLGLAALGLPLLNNCSTKAKKPNILFISVDDLRPQLGCYGNELVVSPNIDKLSSEGATFTNTFCQAAVCGASRASLLTGVRPDYGQFTCRFLDYHARVDEDLPGAPTLPKFLKDKGYTSISNGKVFHHQDDSEDSWSEKPWRPVENAARKYLLDENLKQMKEDGIALPAAFEDADVPDNEYFDGQVADKSIEDLKRFKKSGEPFFLATGFFKPHLPFNAPKKYWDLYNKDDIKLSENPLPPKDVPKDAMHNWDELRTYGGIPKEGPITEELAKKLIHGYYSSVSYMDAQVGKVLKSLEDLGLAENTIVVLWGDHGWNLGDHGLWCKHSNFENVLRAPLIMRVPGHKKNIKIEGLTELVDLYPTLLELTGFKVPAYLEGSSLTPLLKDPNKKWKEAIFGRYVKGETVRTDRYSYTEWRRRNSGQVYSRMLFDHKTDPNENYNIAELEENKEIVNKLHIMLDKGWKAVRM